MENEAETITEAIKLAKKRVRGPFGGHRTFPYKYKVWSNSHNGWWMYDASTDWLESLKQVCRARTKQAVLAYLRGTDQTNLVDDGHDLYHDIPNRGRLRERINKTLERLGAE